MSVAMAGAPAERRTSVLIVEDEWMVAWDLERSLKEMGYQVIATVDSSHEALRVVAERRPDVALMDIRINGGADGITAAAALSEQYGVPVVYLTAYADEETLSRAARTRPYGYVVKPFTSREVRSAIEVARHKHAADVRAAASEQWLETTLRSIGDAVVACDASHQVRFMNRAAEKLTGWSEQEARGRPADEVVRIHSVTGHHHPLRSALADRRPRPLPPGSRLISRAGGEPAEIDDSAALIEHEGTVLGAVLVFRDMTEQQKLRSRVAMSDRLVSLGTLAAGVANELEDSLGSVLTNLAALASAVDRASALLGGGARGEDLAQPVAEMREALGGARVGADWIRRMVADLAKFGRPPSREMEAVNVADVLRWAMRVTAGQVRLRGRLSSDIQPVPPVMGSEGHLGQVFINLLLNAAQALSSGPGPAGSGREGEVRVRCAPAPDGWVSVSVSDTGGGILPEHRDRLFTPFFTTRGPGEGSGLGLYICRTLVAAMGGEINVQSAPGEGSTFEVFLPAAGPENRPVTPYPGPAGQVTPFPLPPVAEARARILVVDDEAMVGRAIRRALGRKHDVVDLSDPQEALRRLEAGEPFDVVLCDLAMPAVSGMELYARLRRRSPELAERLIFLTGGAFTPESRQFLDSVRNLRMEKPFDARALDAVVEVALRRKGEE